MFRELPARRLILLSPFGIPQGAGVLERVFSFFIVNSSTELSNQPWTLLFYLILSRKSRLRFLAGGNVRETCWAEGLSKREMMRRKRTGGSMV